MPTCGNLSEPGCRVLLLRNNHVMSPCVQQSLFLVRQARRSHRNGAPLDCDLDRRQPDTARCRRKNDQIAADKPAGGDRKSTRLNSSPNAQLVCRLLLEKKKK